MISTIHFPITIDASHGRLREEPDHSRHVDQLIRQVLFTNPGERVNLPEFGCGLRRMVFAPNDSTLASLTEITVLEALETWLGDLIKVDRVQVHSRAELLEVKLVYTLRTIGERRFLNLEVEL